MPPDSHNQGAIQDGGFLNWVELLGHRAHQQKDRVAYTFLLDGEQQNASITYGELDRKCRSLAARLQRIGARNERVLLILPPGIDYIVAFFGCLYAGAAAIPAHPPRRGRTAGRLEAMARDARPAFVIGTELTIRDIIRRESGLWGESITFLCIDEFHEDISDEWDKPDIDSQALAYIQYTSGSTTNPRGVMIGHNNLMHNSGIICDAFGHTPDSTGVGWLPLFHDMGLVGNILQSLYAGFSCVLMAPEAFMTKPARWLHAISRYGGTTSGGPDQAYDICARKVTQEQKDGLDLSNWQVAFSGAEPVRNETMENFWRAFKDFGFRKDAFFPCYGLAEATLFVSGGPRDRLFVVRKACTNDLEQGRFHEVEGTGKPGRVVVSCGYTWPESGQAVQIADPDNHDPCKDDVIGEIWVAGPGVSRGYWNQPLLTQEVFGARLADGSPGKYLRTGDLGFIHDGELYVTGRLKDLVIIAGRNHYPQDIEYTVENSHELVESGGSAVFMCDHSGENSVVVVAEIDRRYRNHAPPERLNVSLESLAQEMRQQISEHHDIPVAGICLVREACIPRTSSGKIQRGACRDQHLEGKLQVIYEWKHVQPAESAPTCEGHREITAQEIEAWIISRMAGAMDLDPSDIDRDQPFIEYVIDSLAVVEFTGNLATWLGIDIPISLLWSNPSITDAAIQLADRSRRK